MSSDEIFFSILGIVLLIFFVSDLTHLSRTEVALYFVYIVLYFSGLLFCLDSVGLKYPLAYFALFLIGFFVFLGYAFSYFAKTLLPDEIILRTLLCGGVFYGVLSCGKSLYQGMTFFRWPSTTGKITKSQVQFLEKKLPDLRVVEVYDVQLQYEYQVDGKTFLSSRYAPDQESVEYPVKPRRSKNQISLSRAGSLLKAERFAQQYPLQTSVEIRYHPTQPNIAYLKPKYILLSSWIQPVLGLSASFYMIGLLVLS